ncbi:hypothetical protein MHZ92_08265 [Sporosarcina sp. ACRSL]|uniref:hypothetical protein n=1 Tax=Sporosarcina sp. ACRSL TaxID=2918215 RepID=UPI001EF6CDB0|nr:hypothetical protein [Sporosarcina sp. ACRSL]MCG7344123.1 hypothetical protein [Sporosarcina sp. ACRSL]
MGKKNIGIIIAVLILFIVASYHLYNSRELYGNDKASISKVIKSINDYENKEIEILEINDFEDIRIVGFLSNNQPSYIEFNKNEKGNFAWKHIETHHNESFSMFLPLGISKMMFVTNYESEVAKMQVDINETTIEQDFTTYQATVTWVDLPPTNNDTYEYRNYKYYDEDENLITERN